MSKENTTASQTPATSHELDPRVQLRNPVIAGILAYLVPGLGHFYQRRYFKAFVYCFCILGIFFWGSSMGEAKAVHFQMDAPKHGRHKSRTIGYVAQVGVGLAALPAILQTQRYKSQETLLSSDLPLGTIVEQFDTTFTGLISHRELGTHSIQNAKLVGTLKTGEFGSHEFEGTIHATDKNGAPLEFKLLGNRDRPRFDDNFRGSLTLLITPKICALDEITPINIAIIGHEENVEPEFSAEKRCFMSAIAGDDASSDLGRIYGTIPRAFVDHYQVTIEDRALQHLIRKHGKFFELALVFTWIAGLLNVLAVWDAVSGPAYGYGDEPELDKKKGGKDKLGASASASTSNSDPAVGDANRNIVEVAGSVAESEKG